VSDVQWFVPSLLLATVVSLGLSGRVARALGTRPIVAWALLVGLGLIISATLTPLHRAVGTPSQAVRTCDLSRFGLAPMDQLLVISDTSLNIALFIPMGVAVGLLPASRRKATLILASVALPFGIEGTQLFAPFLNRGCQSADVTDNLTGLVLGLALGLGLRAATASARPTVTDGRRDLPSDRG
jgi:hypothetical protein